MMELSSCRGGGGPGTTAAQLLLAGCPGQPGEKGFVEKKACYRAGGMETPVFFHRTSVLMSSSRAYGPLDWRDGRCPGLS